MSSPTSYGSSDAQGKGTYTPRSSSPRSQTSYLSPSSAASSTKTNSAQSSRGHRYYSKPPPVIHHGGGPTKDTETSTSVSNAGYYT